MKKLLLIVMCIITGLFMVSCGSSSDNESSKVTKLDLKDANNNAKLVFTTANNYVADYAADNGRDYDKAAKMASESCASFNVADISDLKKSDNELDKALYEGLKKEDVTSGKIYLEFEGSDITLAQWSEGGSCVGQYPDPEMDKNAEHEIGGKFERVKGI